MSLNPNYSRRGFGFILLFTIFLGLSLSGCNDVEEANNILPQFNNYFPNTTLYDVDKRILWIQTQIDGISASAAELMFQQDCQQSIPAIYKSSYGISKSIPVALSFDGKKVLIIGFKNFWVVWLVRNGVNAQGIPVNYQVLDYQQFGAWLTQALGAIPTPDQIKVVTLQNAQLTPKGQLLNAPTLAQVRQQEGQVPLQNNPTFAE
jgi:hypothetical protein